MDAYNVIKQAAVARGLALADIGRSMGKRDNYISNMRNRNIGIDNYAAIMTACGYALAAVPVDDLPPSALVVDPAGFGREEPTV